MINVVVADIFSFMLPGFLGEVMAGSAAGFPITQGLLLVFAIIMEIPIAMIFLSRVLNKRVNRWANIIAAVITIIFVISGGSLYLHYYFFAGIEVVCLLLIIWYAWRWPKREA
jgi:hypothetical protein